MKNKYNFSKIEQFAESIVICIYTLVKLLNEFFPLFCPQIDSNSINLLVVVIMFRMIMSRLDRNTAAKKIKFGYIHGIIHDTFNGKKKIRSLRIISYDGDGFYNSMMDLDFSCDKILLLIHSEKEPDKKSIEKWKKFSEIKRVKSIEIRSCSYDKIIFGMNIDGKEGVLGFFDPDYIYGNDKIVSTLTTFSLKQNVPEASEMLNVFDIWFYALFSDGISNLIYKN